MSKNILASDIILSCIFLGYIVLPGIYYVMVCCVGRCVAMCYLISLFYVMFHNQILAL